MSYSPDVYRQVDGLDALRDYNAMGPEPFYNAVGGYALTAWIKACREVEETLTPEQCSSVGWMYTERACCRMRDFLDTSEDQKPQPREQVVGGIRTDLGIAASFFERAESETDDPIFAAFAGIDRASMPLMKHVLIEREAITASDWEALGKADRQAIQQSLEHYRRYQYPADVPRLNILLARLLIGNINATNGTNRLLLPGSARHRNGGDSDYNNWHFTIYDQQKFYHRAQVAPRGAHELLIDPERLNNDFFVTTHGRGGAVACVQLIDYERRCLQEEKHGRPEPPRNLHDKRADHYFGVTTAEIEPYIEEKIQELPIEKADIPEVFTWYDELLPYADPAHERYGNALARIMATLETQFDREGLSAEQLYKLGQVYIDLVHSPQQQAQTLSPKVMRSYLDRAETLFFSTTNTLSHNDPKRYEALIAAASISAHKTLLLGDPEGVLYYQQQLLMVAADMLKVHEQARDKKSPEARATAEQLHEITVYLLPLAQKDIKHVILPALSRQRNPAKKQYFDCTAWRKKETGEFVPGSFAIRFGERPDNSHLDAHIVTLPRRNLSQWKADDNFATLRMLLGRGHVDAVKTKKATDAFRSASKFMNMFLQQATERKPI